MPRIVLASRQQSMGAWKGLSFWVNHIPFLTSDLDQCVAFYREAVGHTSSSGKRETGRCQSTGSAIQSARTPSSSPRRSKCRS